MNGVNMSICSKILKTFFSGLLNFNGPHRDRPLFANGEENEDYNDDEEDNKSDQEQEKAHVEEGTAMVHCSSSTEDHFMEHLPLTLHKGNITEQMRGSARRRNSCGFITVKTMYV